MVRFDVENGRPILVLTSGFRELYGSLQAKRFEELVVQVHMERAASSGKHQADEQESRRTDGGGAQGVAGEG